MKRITREQAEAADLIIDETTNPPTAYRGPRFSPIECFQIAETLVPDDLLQTTVADLGYIKMYAQRLIDTPKCKSRDAFLRQIISLADDVYRRLPVEHKEPPCLQNQT